MIKREYFKMFAGKNIFPYLSWGLFISVGLQEMDEISSAAIKLAKAYNLFIPESDYHSCDPLP